MANFIELRELYELYKSMLPNLMPKYEGKWIGLSFVDNGKPVFGDSRSEVMNQFKDVTGTVLVQEIRESLKSYEIGDVRTLN